MNFDLFGYLLSASVCGGERYFCLQLMQIVETDDFVVAIILFDSTQLNAVITTAVTRFVPIKRVARYFRKCDRAQTLARILPQKDRSSDPVSRELRRRGRGPLAAERVFCL